MIECWRNDSPRPTASSISAATTCPRLVRRQGRIHRSSPICQACPTTPMPPRASTEVKHSPAIPTRPASHTSNSRRRLLPKPLRRTDKLLQNPRPASIRRSRASSRTGATAGSREHRRCHRISTRIHTRNHTNSHRKPYTSNYLKILGRWCSHRRSSHLHHPRQTLMLHTISSSRGSTHPLYHPQQDLSRTPVHRRIRTYNSPCSTIGDPSRLSPKLRRSKLMLCQRKPRNPRSPSQHRQCKHRHYHRNSSSSTGSRVCRSSNSNSRPPQRLSRAGRTQATGRRRSPQHRSTSL